MENIEILSNDIETEVPVVENLIEIPIDENLIEIPIVEQFTEIPINYDKTKADTTKLKTLLKNVA